MKRLFVVFGDETMETPGFGAGSWPGRWATSFDGLSDYYLKAADLDGNANGKELTVSFWFQVNPFTATHVITTNATGYFRVYGTVQSLVLLGSNAGGVNILTHIHSIASQMDGKPHHFLGAVNLATGVVQSVVDDGTIDDTPTTATNDEIAFAASAQSVGAFVGGSSKFAGQLTELYIAHEYIDISVEAQRRKFYTAAGLPEVLGGDGSIPTGTAPIIYAPDGNPANNKGTGGNFAFVGSPTRVAGPNPTQTLGDAETMEY